MADDRQELLDVLHERGYRTITRDVGYETASGVISLDPADRREKPSGWRRFLPRIYSGSDPGLVPSDVRHVVDAHGFSVEPVGRDDDSLTVLIEPHLDQ